MRCGNCLLHLEDCTCPRVTYGTQGRSCTQYQFNVAMESINEMMNAMNTAADTDDALQSGADAALLPDAPGVDTPPEENAAYGDLPGIDAVDTLLANNSRDEEWYQNGQRHRDGDLPAIVDDVNGHQNTTIMVPVSSGWTTPSSFFVRPQAEVQRCGFGGGDVIYRDVCAQCNEQQSNTDDKIWFHGFMSGTTWVGGYWIERRRSQGYQAGGSVGRYDWWAQSN